MALPLEITRAGPFRVARFIGSEFSNLNAPLIQGKALLDPFMVAETLRKQFSGHADLLVLEKVQGQGATEKLLAAFRRTHGTNPSFQLQLGSDFAATLSRLDTARRMKKFRSTARKFEASGGWRWGEAGDQADALRLFFEQKAARFRSMGIPDAFAKPETKEFFRQLVLAPKQANDYALRLFTLEVGKGLGRTVAIAGLSRKGERVTCQFGSIDDSALPGTSPGDFLFHLLIEHLSDGDVSIFDFGVGDQPYKRAWCNVETTLYDFVLPLNARGDAAVYAHGAIGLAKRWIKARPALYRAVQAARSKLART